MSMDRGSAKHGAVRDEVLAHEVAGFVRARRDTRVDEWRSPEPPAEDTSALAARPDGAGVLGSAPPGMTSADVEERSELARWLGRAVFPAERNEVMDHLRHQHAPDRVVDEVGGAPEGIQFTSLGQLWRALRADAHVESRRY
ncbi:DUF2795 domain-containing protein [Parafrankia sp. EUN1f]|uniref:DUF2795 domain-containing protein n=1 Tax=Parafrankia sp. EUN1f TaxID=102897 RepID=UPI0001C44DCF|nr:DUF2795 domain-containing protein [Parafrankia sp. EUN1f]EFC84700.1 hypothetical protein FrEUN1fDRAFT_2151 [Parafrankia sp. EUN1f]